MWERVAFLAFFLDLCLAQQGAIADIRARQLQARQNTGDMVALPIAHNHLEARQVDEALANVFVTVLFPEVPTGAPTGIAVPIEVTYTGTFDAAAVPTGFQTPTDLATAPATPAPTDVATPAPTTDTPTTTVATPTTEATTTQQTSETTQSTQPTTSTQPSTTASTTASSTTSASSSPSRTASSASNTASSAANSASPSAVGDSNHSSLSAGAIAGIVIGVVAFIAGLVLLFLFLMRPSKRKSMRVSSPVYPEEAYLYDPPMSTVGGAGGMPLDADTRSIKAQSFGRPPTRPGTPNMGETQGLLAGAAAGGAMAAGAAARSRRGTMSGANSPNLRPVMGGNGYAPVDTRDITDLGHGNPFADQDTTYRGSTDAGPSGGAAWPMNPQAPSGLGTPPQSSAGPSNAAAAPAQVDPVESRSQTPGSMYRNDAGYNPAMREARRAWGMDD